MSQSQDRVRLGLIGAGRIGRIHAEQLTRRVDHAELVTVYDVFSQAARQAAHDFAIPQVAPSLEAMLNDSSLDGVVICSSTDTHAEIMVQAAQAGKHIFCEKPIALDLAEVDRALAAVEAAGVKLQVGFNRRFHANFQRVRELVQSGAVGTPHLVRITSRDCAPPPVSYVKVSGGIFLDMTIHDFDMARFLLGQEVEEVFASGSVLVDPEIGAAGDVDTAVVVMRYTSGAICTIDNSREAVYGYDQRVEVFGSGGMAMSHNNTPYNVTHYTADHGYTPLPYFPFLPLYRESYIAEMQAFVDAVRHNTTPPVTGLDGRYPLVMGLAATKSLREGRPVKLSEIHAS